MATGPFLEPQSEPSGDCEEPIVDFPEVCQMVAKRISKDWKKLGRKMGFIETDVDNLEIDHRQNGVEETAYKLLQKWQQKLGKASTLNLLAQHLQKIEREDLSSEIIEMAKEPKNRANIPPTSNITSTGTHASCGSGRLLSCSPSISYSRSELKRVWKCVKTMLRNDHSLLQIPKVPWLEETWEIGFEDYYVDLTISNKNEEAKPLQLHEIFSLVSQKSCDRSSRILIEGPAGYGKSTLARKLCFDHAKEKSYIQQFDAVILLRLREFNGTLEETIINTLELKDYTAELVLESIKQNQSKVLFILDGLDELHQDKHRHVIPLLKGKHYPQSTVIVTSRMGDIKLEGKAPDSSVASLLHCMNCRVSIIGLTGENRITFLQLYLKGYFSEKCDSFIKSIDEKFGLSKVMKGNLFDCPLYLLLLVIVAEETDLASLTSKTQLYKQLFNFILRRTLAKEGQVGQAYDFFEFSVENPPAHVNMLFRFGSFAGDSLSHHKYTFTEEEILRGCGNDGTILKLGILTRNDAKIGLQRMSWFEPLHLSFLEFAYAYSIWVGCVSTHPSFRFLSKHLMLLLDTRILYSYHNKLVASFVSGLCWKQLPTFLSAFTVDYNSLVSVTNQLDQEEMMAESQLKLGELGKAFLPIIPVEFSVDQISENLLVLVKEALMHAVQTRRDQRIIFEQKEFIAIEQHQGSGFKFTTHVNALVSVLESEVSFLESKEPFIASKFSNVAVFPKTDFSDLDSKFSLLDLEFTNLNSVLWKLNSSLENSGLWQLNSKFSRVVFKLSSLTSMLPNLLLEFSRLLCTHSFSELGNCVSKLWRSVSEFWHSCSEDLLSDSGQLLSDSEHFNLVSEIPNFYCKLPVIFSEIISSMHSFLCSINGLVVSVSELQHSECEFLLSVYGCLLFLCEIFFFFSNVVYSFSVNFVSNFEILRLNSKHCPKIYQYCTFLLLETVAAISGNPKCSQLKLESSCLDSAARNYECLNNRLANCKLLHDERPNVILQDWRELTTSQNIKVAEMGLPNNLPYAISFTICEAPLQEQLRWLSDFMTIEGVFQNKHIHTIHYDCSSEKVPNLIVLMTELIRQKRLVGVNLFMKKACECLSAESWKEFIRCANESKELLDIFLRNEGETHLVVDLTPAEGKRWRNVVFERNVVLNVGSQTVCVGELNTDSVGSLLSALPPNIQMLKLSDDYFAGDTHIFRNGGLTTAHNVDELSIKFSRWNLSLLQSGASESFKKLKVLTVEQETYVTLNESDVTTFLLSMMYHCHSLVRIELDSWCTQLFLEPFLERLIKDKWPVDQGDSVKTSLHLNTLMIPTYYLLHEESIRRSTIAKEALQTGCIERLWVELNEYVTRTFLELFFPAERFNFKVVNKQSWSKHNRRWGTVSVLEIYLK